MRLPCGEAPDKPAQLRTAVFEFLADAPRPAEAIGSKKLVIFAPKTKNYAIQYV